MALGTWVSHSLLLEHIMPHLGLKQHKLVIGECWRSEIHSQAHGAGAKVWALFFLKMVGGGVCFSGFSSLWRPPFLLLVATDPVLSVASSNLSLTLVLWSCHPSLDCPPIPPQKDSGDYSGPTQMRQDLLRLRGTFVKAFWPREVTYLQGLGCGHLWGSLFS